MFKLIKLYEQLMHLDVDKIGQSLCSRNFSD